MLLPISHEKLSSRRLPVVTIAIILISIVLHGVVGLVSPAIEARAVAAIVSAEELRHEHPSFESCPALAKLGTRPASELSELFGKLSKIAADDAEQKESRARYDAACAELETAIDALPSRRFGFVPARGNWIGLVTATFMHGDWFHVLGNMWFLLLCGLALEDRWGRLPFAVYYVASGIVATLAHYLTNTTSPVPVIGASGAVAAAMGAFLVLFATTKIRFVGVIVYRLVWFSAPAYVMLPLWIVIEILLALVGDEGTARWAHVGGFVFGAAAAGAFRLAGVDRKLDDAVERVAVLGDDPRVDAARALMASGDAAQAVTLLEGLSKEKPESIHVWEALRDAALQAGDARATEEATRMLETLHRAKGREAEARAVRASSPSQPLPPSPSKPPLAATTPSSRPSGPAATRPVSTRRASAPSVRTPSVHPPSAGPVAAAAPATAPAPAAASEAPYFPPPPPRR